MSYNPNSISGPVVSTVDAIAVFANATGSATLNSGILIDSNANLLWTTDEVGNLGVDGPGYTGTIIGPVTITASQGDSDNGYFVTSTDLDALGFVQDPDVRNNIVVTYLTGANAGVVGYASYTTANVVQNYFGGPNQPGIVDFPEPFAVSSGDTISISSIPMYTTFSQAFGNIGNIIFTAKNLLGTSGNVIVVQFVNDAPGVGQEYVTQSGTTVTYHIVSGSSTESDVINAYQNYGSPNSGGFNPAILVTPQLTDAGTSTVSATSITLANGFGVAHRPFSIQVAHSLIIDADSRFTPFGGSGPNFSPSKLQIGPLTIETGGYPTSTGDQRNSIGATTFFLGTPTGSPTPTNAVIALTSGISAGLSNINYATINANLFLGNLNSNPQASWKLAWSTDIGGTIGSLDGGTTFQRPGNVYVGSLIQIGDPLRDGQFNIYESGSSVFNVAGGNVHVSNIFNVASQTTLTGTAGTAICSEPEQGSSYKKVIIFLNGSTDTGTQTYTFPTPFVNTPFVYGLAAGVSGASATTTNVTFTVTGQTGFVFLEGY